MEDKHPLRKHRRPQDSMSTYRTHGHKLREDLVRAPELQSCVNSTIVL